MALTTGKIEAVRRGVTARFDLGYELGSPLYTQLCTQTPSKGYDEDYSFLGSVPGMREWLGDRVFHEMRAGNYAIVNRDWEQSLNLNRFNVDDDRIGLYGSMAENLGSEAKYHPDELLVDAIVDGEATACWDGQFFFDTDHTWGDSGAQSNDLVYTPAAGAGGAIVAADIKAAFNSARRALLGFKNDRGKKMNRQIQASYRNLAVMIPADLDQEAADALLTRNYQFTTGVGGDNVVIDRPRILTLAGLTNARKMYVANLGAPLKPFIFQLRQRLRRGTKGGDDIEFKNIKLMTEARYALGYGPWWTIVIVTFEDA